MIRERWGILQHGSVFELANISLKPETTFLPASQDYVHLDHPETVATWHTHPRSDNKPSEEDTEAFLAWPHLVHYILGNNGIAAYKIINGEVIDHDCTTWLPEELIQGNGPVPGIDALGSLARAHDADLMLQGEVGAEAL